MIKVTVNGGACGFMTQIEADAEGRDTTLKIETDCPALKTFSGGTHDDQQF